MLSTLKYLRPFVFSRLRGVYRLVQQPHLRGPEWFLDVPVRADFYAGPGKAILRDYWLRVGLPFLLDIPVLAAMYVTGQLTLLLWLMIVPVLLTVYHRREGQRRHTATRSSAHGNDQRQRHGGTLPWGTATAINFQPTGGGKAAHLGRLRFLKPEPAFNSSES
jgi:hypothetical protein